MKKHSVNIACSLHPGVPVSLPTSSLGYDSLSCEAVPRLPYCTCTAGPRIRCSGGSRQSGEMPWAAPGDTCPQSADGRAGQRSRSGGGQQQQQRPEQQQKSREVARGGWEQHDGLEELPGSVSREVAWAHKVRRGRGAALWQSI